MNDPNENPYPDHGSNRNTKPEPDKGSIFAGFFIGWGLMIGSSILTGFVVSVMTGLMNSSGNYNNPFFQMMGLVSLVMPLAIIVAAMVWFGKQGKSKIVKGIAAAILSSIALVILLVAACFGIFALSGGF